MNMVVVVVVGEKVVLVVAVLTIVVDDEIAGVNIAVVVAVEKHSQLQHLCRWKLRLLDFVAASRMKAVAVASGNMMGCLLKP